MTTPDQDPLVEQASAAGSKAAGRVEQPERDRLVLDLFAALSRANEAEQELADSQQELQQVYASISWRLTWPLRVVSLFCRRLAHPRQILRSMASIGATKITRYPAVRHFVEHSLDRFPSAKEAVRRLVAPSIINSWSEDKADYARTITFEKLPRQARAIYAELESELSAPPP